MTLESSFTDVEPLLDWWQNVTEPRGKKCFQFLIFAKLLQNFDEEVFKLEQAWKRKMASVPIFILQKCSIIIYGSKSYIKHTLIHPSEDMSKHKEETRERKANRERRVTRWLGFFFNIWQFTAMIICPKELGKILPKLVHYFSKY